MSLPDDSPKNPRKLPLDVTLKIRVSASELAVWKARANGADAGVSALIRASMNTHISTLPALAPTRKRLHFVPVDPALIHQIARVGSNINQIARKLHSLKIDTIDTIRLLTTLAEISADLASIRDTWSLEDGEEISAEVEVKEKC